MIADKISINQCSIGTNEHRYTVYIYGDRRSYSEKGGVTS